ncbi:hypothetical protein Trydic_g11453 [Trypoxylus dichotomus]
MNQVKQVLNTCSPLEKIGKINGALGAGVNALSKKLYSEQKNVGSSSSYRGGKTKDERGVAKVKQQKICDPCAKYKPKVEEKQTSVSTLPGCMPFTDNVPVRPYYREEALHPVERIHPSLKNKGCGCNLGIPIPPEDEDEKK